MSLEIQERELGAAAVCAGEGMLSLSQEPGHLEHRPSPAAPGAGRALIFPVGSCPAFPSSLSNPIPKKGTACMEELSGLQFAVFHVCIGHIQLFTQVFSTDD